MERQVRPVRAAFRWIDRVCAVRDSQGRLTVELYGEGIDDITKQGTAPAGLSALLGVTLTAPEKKRAARASMLRCTNGRQCPCGGRHWPSAEGGGARRSRATTRATFTDTGTACLLLSDGMGSGAAASRDSRMLITSLERFLRAGISVGDALHAVSPALRLRSDGMRFTTLDAFTLDLFSGRAEKPQVRRHRLHAAERSMDHSAGHGAAHRSGGGGRAGDAVPLQMNDGDIVVLLSDGVTDGTDDK